MIDALRLWPSLKYEEVFLRDYDGMREARDGIGRYFAFFNEERGHQSLECRTPMEVYAESVRLKKTAA